MTQIHTPQTSLAAQYAAFGISEAVLNFAAPVMDQLRPRFDSIDETAEYNQLRVIHAMQENHIRRVHHSAKRIDIFHKCRALPTCYRSPHLRVMQHLPCCLGKGFLSGRLHNLCHDISLSSASNRVASSMMSTSSP